LTLGLKLTHVVKMIITIDLLSPKNQTAIALSTPKITIALSKKTGVRYSTKIKQRSHLMLLL
jgi:hypothetical protein